MDSLDAQSAELGNTEEQKAAQEQEIAQRKAEAREKAIERHVVGGVVNVHKSLAACQEDRAIRQQLAQAEQAEVEVKHRTRALQEAREHLNEERCAYEEAATHATPEKFNLRELQSRVKEASRAMDEAERLRDIAVVRLHKLRPVAEALRKQVTENEAVLREAAALRAANEGKVGKQFLRMRRADANMALHEAEAQRAEDESRVEAAQKEREKARKRVQANKKATQNLLESVEAQHSQDHERRARAILQLKRSTETIQAEMAGKIAQRKAQEARVAQREQEEFNEILEAGGNPYEVFRRRKQDARVKRAKERIQLRLKQSEMQLMKKMLAFDEYNRVKDSQEAKEKAYEDQYTKSLGRHAAEERTLEYMRSRTIGGVDSIDPSGRAFRVEPSQVTVMKTHAFGLGNVQRERSDIVDKIAAQPANAGIEPIGSLIPARLRPFIPPEHLNPTGAPKADKRKLSQAAVAQRRQLEEEGKQPRGGVDAEARILERQNDAALGPPPGMSFHPSDSFKGDDRVEDERRLVLDVIQSSVSSAALESPAEQNWNKFKGTTRDLSVFEQKMLRKAREAQLRNVVQDQVVWGKTFEGQAFLVKPSVIHYKDFIVGESYSKTFTLTNVSYTFNSFKLLELPDDIKNFFTVTYEKPGRMSAGLTCRIRVDFEPKVNEDIVANLPFLANTGPFNVPIKCTKRKTIPALSKSTLDFGTVVHGETKTLVLKIANEGALPCSFSLGGDCYDSKDLTMGEPVKFELTGYDETNMSITYGPQEDSPVEISKTLEIIFKDGQHVHCTIVAATSKVPIYAASSKLDFQCCVFGKLYRNKLVLRNRGSVALRAEISPPKPLRDCIEFLPDMGFVQARDGAKDGSFDVQIKVRPSQAIVDWCTQTNNCTREEDATFGQILRVSIPINIHVPEQVLPVKLALVATLTSGEIALSPATLDFGFCYTTQSVQRPLVLENTSLLPQRFGFVKLRPQVSVEPSNGFGTLLPKERIVSQVIFSPSSAVEYAFSLTLRTSLNRTFQIPCKGVGLDPPLHFSQTLVAFNTCALGTRRTQSLFLTNTSREIRDFHIVLPLKKFSHGLHVSPQVGRLNPGEVVRIEVELTAPSEKDGPFANAVSHPEAIADGDGNETEASATENNEEVGVADETSNAASSEEKNSFEIPPEVGSVVWSNPDEGEPWSKHCEWLMRCHVRGFEVPLALQVNAVHVDSDLVADQDELRFSQVAVGHSKTLVLRIRNFGNTMAHLTSDSLNPVGPFMMVNALRDIPVNGSHAVNIKFTPSSNRTFQEVFTIRSQAAKLDILLCGEGVSPKLSVSLQNPADGSENSQGIDNMFSSDQVVDFGDVLAHESSTRNVYLQNKSVFGLDYAIKVAPVANIPRNLGGRDVFVIGQQKASIPAMENRQVQIRFEPDQERLSGHFGVFEVDVPNQIGKHTLRFQGRAWSHPIFARMADVGMVAPRDRIANEFAFSAGTALSNYTLVGCFDDTSDGKTIRIVVGSCSTTRGGSYEIVRTPETIVVDKPKGALKPGEKVTLTLALQIDRPGSIGEHIVDCVLTMDNQASRKVRIVLRKNLVKKGN